MAHITMHHSRKQFNLFHNSLAVHQYELFSFYKSINLKINILLLPVGGIKKPPEN